MADEIRQSLDSTGFHVRQQHLDADTVGTLLADLVAALSPLLDKSDSQTAARLKRGVAFARRNLLSAAAVRNFLTTDVVMSLVESISPGFVAVRAILFDKTGAANWTVPWHQDRSIAVRERIDVHGFGPWSTKARVVHVQPPVEILRRMFTLRFSLDACGIDNGPLRVIAGTHRNILDAAEIETIARASRESLCTTSVGGVVIMRPLVLHASSPAKSVGHRRVLHIEFGPPELPAGLAWAMA